MPHFSYRDGEFCAEAVSLKSIAQRFGTPTYVYSKAALVENFSAYAQACRQHARGADAAL
ncbi:MAG TPA: diaminopimelate decarboxylase, partial [Noviherbaspirillum sp.]